MHVPYDLVARCALETHGNILNNRGLHNYEDHHDLKVRAQPSPDEQRKKTEPKRVWLSLIICSFVAPSSHKGTYWSIEAPIIAVRVIMI